MIPEAYRLPLAIVFVLACIVAVIMMFSSVSQGAGIMYVVTRLLPWTRTAVFRTEREARDEGFVAHGALQYLIGQVGVLEADARPVGKARFGKDVVTVEAEADMIRRGTRVQGVSVRGGVLVIRPAAPPDVRGPRTS